MWTVTKTMHVMLKFNKGLICLTSVHLEGTHIWAVLCLCVEWIVKVYLTGSHWPILFCLKLQNNTQAHLRILWTWMSFASGTESSAQESGCPPKTIFVKEALFQTFTVYYILQPSLPPWDRVSDLTVRFQLKALSCFFNHSKKKIV